MQIRKTVCCGCFLVVAALVVWIFLNPYSTLQTVQKRPDILKSIDDFFSSIGLSYHFSFKDIASVMRFTEYLLFGIFATVTAKFLTKSILKNISTPLFMGLLVAVAEVYFKFLQNITVNVSMVVSSFVAFCAGGVVCLIFTKKKSSKKSYKFKI